MARREPQQRRSQRTYARVLEAGRRLLSEEGAASFNTNRIAAEAGISVGTLYSYFDDKTDIARAIIEVVATEGTDRLLALWEGVAEQDLDGLVRHTVEFAYDLYRDNGTLYRDLWTVADEPQRMVGYRAGERAVVAEIVRRIAPHSRLLGIDDPERTASIAFHLAESMCATLAPEGASPWSRDVVVDEIARAVRAYLLAGAGR